MTGSLQNRRVWLIGSGVIALVLIAATYFMLISPALGDADAVRSQTSGVELQNTQAEQANTQLARRYSRLSVMQAKLSTLIEAVPPTAALPEFTRETNAQAKRTGVAIQNLAITAPTAIATSTSASPVADSTATPAPPASTSGSTVSGPVSLYQIPVTVSAGGSVDKLVDFAAALQHGARDVLVSNAVFAGSGNSATLTLQADIYTAPMSQQQLTQTRDLLKSVK